MQAFSLGQRLWRSWWPDVVRMQEKAHGVCEAAEVRRDDVTGRRAPRGQSRERRSHLDLHQFKYCRLINAIRLIAYAYRAFAWAPWPVECYRDAPLPGRQSAGGLAGRVFTDIHGASEGTVDHTRARYRIQRGLHHESRRALARSEWTPFPRGFSVWRAGDEQRFDWRGGGIPSSSLLICMSPSRCWVMRARSTSGMPHHTGGKP